MKKNPTLLELAYIRDGHSIHTGEAVVLACLLHTHGGDRKGMDMRDVQRIMKDQNLNEKPKRD